MPPQSPDESADLPLPLAGHEAAFSHARSTLAEVGFDEATLCRDLAMNDMSDLGSVAWDRLEPKGLPTARLVCARAFLHGERLTRALWIEALGSSAVHDLERVGLLRPVRGDPDRLVSPVWLYPVDGFLIASDRHDDPDGRPHQMPADVVFPAIYAGTLRFLKLLPERPDADALDLCGGSGIGALHLARSARTATSADVTLRSAHFAAFNARLNGVHNVSSVCGDLYEPVRDRRYDLITAHPPFVPSTTEAMIYRDAGPGGEDVTRAIVEGLPHHLRPGGRCVILCMGQDTADQPFEARARAWLGAVQHEFDVVFGVEKTHSIEEVLDMLARRKRGGPPPDPAVLRAALTRAGTRHFVYGALVCSREAAPAPTPHEPRLGARAAGPPGRRGVARSKAGGQGREPVAPSQPHRLRLSPQATARDLDRLIAWRSSRAQPGFLEWLAETRPRLDPRLELTVRHTVDHGALAPTEFVFRLEEPFPSAIRLDGWVVPLIARFDGQERPVDLYTAARAADELPVDFQVNHFLDLVATLVDHGYLALPDAPPLAPGRP